MHPPTVSVVIPAYRAEKTVGAALASVIAQADLCKEIIVVDDASDDDTATIARKTLQASGVKFKILSLPQNAGPAAARNRGVADAKGEWIAFLDGDDVWMPWKLARQLSVIAENPEVGMVCGGVRSFASDTELDTALTAPSPEQVAVGGILLVDFVENNPVATSTVVVRRDLLAEVGGFDPHFRGPEDLDLWLRIAARSRIVTAKTVVSLYRYVPCSLSMDDRKFLPEVLRVLDKAFADGGALAGQRHLRRRARSTQYWNASWMAFGRSDKAMALGYWAKAWWLNLDRNARVRRPWLRLLLRYVATLPGTCGGCG